MEQGDAAGEWLLAPERGVARGKALALTCLRSFHRTAPLGAETAGPWWALPIMGPLPASASVPPAPAAATCDSITRADWTRRRLRRGSPLSGPANFFPVRTCDAGLLPTALTCTLPEFRISGVRIALATRTAASRHCTSFLVAILSEGEPEWEGPVEQLQGSGGSRCFLSRFVSRSPEYQKQTNKQTRYRCLLKLVNPGKERKKKRKKKKNLFLTIIKMAKCASRSDWIGVT